METSPSPASATGRSPARRCAKVDGRDFVTGTHAYTSRPLSPGMLHGKVLRPAGFKATLVSLDSQRSREDPGRQGRCGTANSSASPRPTLGPPSARPPALKAQVERCRRSRPSRDLFEYLKKNEETGGAASEARVKGSVEEGMASADVKLSQTYTVEYIAHAPLEPRAAVAEWKGDKADSLDRDAAPLRASATSLPRRSASPREKVRVSGPDTGSAYGGKHTGDAAIEAARLAKAAGKPVKVVWTREEEFTWAYFRPAGVIEVASGARRDGTITALGVPQLTTPARRRSRRPYRIANQRIQFHPVKVAAATGLLPRRSRRPRTISPARPHGRARARRRHGSARVPLKNLADPRLKAVFEAAAEKFGWSAQKAAPGVGFGIAGGVEKGGYVATCAEV